LNIDVLVDREHDRLSHDANRMSTFFGKARGIEHQHGIRFADFAPFLYDGFPDGRYFFDSKTMSLI